MFNHAQIYVTSHCNMSCPRCAGKHRISNVDDWKGHIPYSQFTSVVDRLQSEGVHLETFGFSGGEPTLWPMLFAAIGYVRRSGICDKIRVYSNAIERYPVDYADADEIWVSHYGFANRSDILRLRKYYGDRLKVGYGSHVGPEEYEYNPLPKSCNCLMYIFCGNSVYPCGWAALRGARQYAVPFDSDFVTQFKQIDPLCQDICHTCPYNHPKKPLTIEIMADRWRLLSLPGWMTKVVRKVRPLLR